MTKKVVPTNTAGTQWEIASTGETFNGVVDKDLKVGDRWEHPITSEVYEVKSKTGLDKNGMPVSDLDFDPEEHYLAVRSEKVL